MSRGARGVVRLCAVRVPFFSGSCGIAQRREREVVRRVRGFKMPDVWGWAGFCLLGQL